MAATVHTLHFEQKIIFEDGRVIIPPGTTLEHWAEELGTLQASHKSFSWWLGRMCLWGEEHFGENWSSALRDYSAESAQSAMRVCRAFPEHRVRRRLGFTYHAACLAKVSLNGPYLLTEAEQDALLERAEREGWTRSAMRAEIADIRKRLAAAAPVRPSAPLTVRQRSDSDIETDEPEAAPAPDEADACVRAYLDRHDRSLDAEFVQAMHVLLDEREKLRMVATEARRALNHNILSQELAEAIAALGA